MPKVNPNIMNELANVELNSLEHLCRMGSTLSTEALDLAFIDTLKGKFNDFVDRSSTFLNGLRVGNYRNNHLDYHAAVSSFTAQPYATNRTLQFHVAPGFSGSWLPFLNFVISDLLPQVEQLEATLQKSNTRLAQILNEPDRMAAQSGIKELKNQLPTIQVKTLEHFKSAFFTKGDTMRQASTLIDRNADVETVYKLTNEVNDRLARVRFNAVEQSIGRFAELSKSFKEHLDKHDDAVSGKVGSQLSELFYVLGVTCSAAAVVLEVVPQHVQAMEKNLGVLSKKTAVSA